MASASMIPAPPSEMPPAPPSHQPMDALGAPHLHAMGMGLEDEPQPEPKKRKRKAQERITNSEADAEGMCTYSVALLNKISHRFEHCKKTLAERKRAVYSTKLYKSKKQGGAGVTAEMLADKGLGLGLDDSSPFSGGLYQHTRLKQAVMALCFDAHGNYMYHPKGLAQFFGCGESFFASCQKALQTIVAQPLVKIPRKEVLERGWEEYVVMPPGELRSRTGYLHHLDDDDEVTVVNQIRSRGMGGGARAMTAQREAFRRFVVSRRSPSGRNHDDQGGYHGPQYYLDACWSTTRASQSQAKDGSVEAAAELAKSKKAPHECEVFSVAARAAIEREGLNAPHDTRICEWLKQDFGLNCERGHTVINPRAAGRGSAAWKRHARDSHPDYALAGDH